MCERTSLQSLQHSPPHSTQQQQIKSLQQQLATLQTQIQQKDKQIEQLSEVKKNVKKIPFNIYKEFLITAQTDGSVVNLVRQKSLEHQRITFGEQSVKLSDNGHAYQQYLLIKIKGDKPALYVSANTEISTLEKLNLTKYAHQERQSYAYVAPNLQSLPSIEVHHNLQLQRKVVECQISQANKPKRAQLNQEQKKLLMFPPSSIPDLKRKQSLPLKTECQILSDDLKKLRQKLSTYTKVLQQKATVFPISTKSFIDPEDSKTNNQKNISDFIESKMKEVSPMDFDELLQTKWKKQKQEYIDYISNLQKQLKSVKNSQSFISNKEIPNSKSYIEKSPAQSEIKSPRMFDSTPYAALKANGDPSQQSKYTIFKSEPEETPRSYFKNQYHLNQQEKSRSKSKGSKVIYLRRG